MKETIKNLWLGNLCPADSCGTHNPEVAAARQKAFHLHDQLKSLLTTKEQNATLEQFIEAESDHGVLLEQHAFTLGFCLGMRLSCEARSDE